MAVMESLSAFPLPLSMNGPPVGYGWEERDTTSLASKTSAFNSEIDRRDKFLGERRCVICGSSRWPALERCLIIGRAVGREVWPTLYLHKWFPPQAKSHPQHEPRNALIMCKNHHMSFNAYDFFIRFVPGIRKFVFVNYSNHPKFQSFHGKAIALDIRDRYAPFPSLFIIHEMRVRAMHPFQHDAPAISHDLSWQDWISSGGFFDDTSGSFNRAAPPDNGNDDGGGPASAQTQLPTTGGGGGSSAGLTLELNSNVIAEILSATRAMPSWKACQVEGTSWTGTAEENIQKYVSSIGVEGCPPP